MKNKKLMKNTVSSLSLQITTIVCGFILPRLIVGYYGSEVNGLVQSITQFLSLITFLEFGVGAVVRSSLYKPLVINDTYNISAIWVSANKFFRTVALILFGYVVLLIIVYPIIINNNYDFIFTTTLIIAISISSFAQYYFGIVNGLLLTADQRGYILYYSQMATIVMNTIASVALINLETSIQVLKLTTSLIFLLRPLVLHIYVRRYYKIDKHIKYDVEPIKQKWNGVAQHFAYIVLDYTDNIVLTLFSTLTNVSIYSVHFLVVNGVKSLFLSLTAGIQSFIGELWAKKEVDRLRKYFSIIEWVIHSSVTFVFGATVFLICPFIQVYTKGIADVNYYVPVFAVLITLANALHCLRLPYNILILAAGHYKQTQNNYIIAALINLIISIVLVSKIGLVGVAIGTIVAMSYQTVWMAIYDSKNIINWPIQNFIKSIFIDAITLIISWAIIRNFEMQSCDYQSWCVLAIEVASILFIIMIIINNLLYPNRIKKIIQYVINKR